MQTQSIEEASKPHKKQIEEAYRPRRKQVSRLTSEQRQVLAAEYHAYPQDQLLTDRLVAARAQCSRGHLMNLRVRGTGGPRYLRTETGRIFYRKADVEAWLSRFKQHVGTQEYKDKPA